MNEEISENLVPDWASKSGYFHHSNPHSQPFSRTAFDKCHKRIETSKAWKVINNDKYADTAEEVNKAWETIRLYEVKSAAMQGGISVQEMAEARLVHEDEELYKEALRKYTEDYVPVDHDVYDTVKFSHYKGIITDITANAIAGLREVGQELRLNKFEGEREYWEELPGCELKYNGREDFVTGHIELKTRWPSINKQSKTSKSSFKKGYIQSKPLHGWIGQVAGYWFTHGQSPTIVVANQDEYKIFNKDNCSMLTDEYLDTVVKSTIQKCKSRENVFQAADALSQTRGTSIKEEIFGLVEHDFSDWRWLNENPEVLTIAKEVWGLE